MTSLLDTIPQIAGPLEVTNSEKMKNYYVYILKCSDTTYYTGLTSNLSKRVEEHQTGIHRGSYTFWRRPVHLVFYAEFNVAAIAINTEKQIKNWPRSKKEALINGEFFKLPSLAKKKNFNN